MDAVVVIPTIDPDSRLLTLVDDLRERGLDKVIVVDDGSQGDTKPVLDALKDRGAHVFYHVINLGKGQAIKTALMHVRSIYPDATHVVTMDDDGQHLPEDVEAACRVAGEFPDRIVLGTRNLHGRDVPLRSRLGNAFSSAYFKLDTGMTCRDTQTGLRVIPLSLLGLALSTPGRRYDYEMNFLTDAVKHGVSVATVPIATIYENNNEASHFSPIRDSWLIYKQFFRFAGSSVLCACIDLGLFALITALVNLDTALLVACATAIARVSSGILNFTMNRRWSFTDSGSLSGEAGVQAVRYLTLFVAQMIASMVLVTLLSFMPMPLVVVKAFVDGGLFVVSYFAQRNWVFKRAAKSNVVVVKGGARDTGKQRASLPTL